MAALSPLQTGGEGHDGASKSPNLGQVGAAASAPSAAAAGTGTAAASTALASTEISSPHELTDWVDSVLDQLETRFESMNDQVVQRSERPGGGDGDRWKREGKPASRTLGSMIASPLTPALFLVLSSSVKEMSNRIDALESSIEGT